MLRTKIVTLSAIPAALAIGFASLTAPASAAPAPAAAAVAEGVAFTEVDLGGDFETVLALPLICQQITDPDFEEGVSSALTDSDAVVSIAWFTTLSNCNNDVAGVVVAPGTQESMEDATMYYRVAT